jgi:hypothetical protein
VFLAKQSVSGNVLQGASSFAKKLTYGFSDSFSKVTGSIGKGAFDGVIDRHPAHAAFQAYPRPLWIRNGKLADE